MRIGGAIRCPNHAFAPFVHQPATPTHTPRNDGPGPGTSAVPDPGRVERVVPVR